MITPDTKIPDTGNYFDGKAGRIVLKNFRDHRGMLCPLEFEHLPFLPKRMFFITDVPVGSVRGQHGHKKGMQLLVCLHGAVQITMQHGQQEVVVNLDATSQDDTSLGLFFGPGIYCEQQYLKEGSVLLVLCSESYDENSYIHTKPGDEQGS